MAAVMPQRTIGTIPREATVMGLGYWIFGDAMWGSEQEDASRSAIRAALDHGITHFDTAQGYGGGRSESVLGEFMPGHRASVFLATKMSLPTEIRRDAAVSAVEESLKRLRTDTIDLFYIHWPRAGADLRPLVLGLEDARREGKIRGIGVSNFSVEQINQVMQAGTIDAHQICYNLLWRFPEQDVIPFCEANGIATVTYSSIAQGILTGKFGPDPEFRDGDQRPRTIHFDREIYPHVHAGVDEMKSVAQDAGRPLVELAIRWCAAQSGVASVLVGARSREQVERNVRAMEGRIPPEVFQRLTRISDEVQQHIPAVGNIFRFYP